MPVTTYLFFNGNCAEAMGFYERALGGKLEGMMKYAEEPAGTLPPHVDPDKIMHARMSVGNGFIMASDDMSGQQYRGMSGFGVSVEYRSATEARRVYEALAKGGTVIMPMTKTFWSEAFGMVNDRFGTPWMIGVEAPVR